MSRIVYDLTEIFYSSRGKLKYYGIVRVVAEIACEVHKIDPTAQFAIYSPAHDDFFQVFPTLDENAEGGVSLNVPVEARPVRIREIFHSQNRLRDLVLWPVRAIVRIINRRNWQRAGVDLPRLNLDGASFVTAGRPKLMLAPLRAIERAGGNVKVHVLLHDMFPLHNYSGHRVYSFPRNFLGDNRYVIARAAQILANSEFTRQEILAFSAQGVLPAVPKIVAVPLVHECRPGSEPPEKTIPDEPYLLAVGALVGRKNIEIAFNAMLDLYHRAKPVPRLILAGAPRDHIRKYLSQERYAPIRDRIEQSVDPNQTDLVRFYSGALALVIGSRIEGWGLPAGEALWLGTPVLCSTAPVFREVCGDLGLYFDPDSPRELADHIDRLMNETGFKVDLVGRIRAARTSLRKWSDVARELLAAVKEFR